MGRRARLGALGFAAACTLDKRGRCVVRGRFACIAVAAIEDRRIGHAAFRVLCSLASFSDKDGSCWPSTKTIASQLSMARSTVFEHLQALAALGYLTIHGSLREDGGRAANRYRMVARTPVGKDGIA